jgi:anti-sigma B factor antagonist
MTPVSVNAADHGVLDVMLRGEIDYTNAASVNQVIRLAVAQRQPSLVRIDLTEVTFLDSSGIGVLVHGMKEARSADAQFLVRGASPKVLDQLRITGLVELFPVEAA